MPVFGSEKLARAALARCEAAGAGAVELAEAVAVFGNGVDLHAAGAVAGLEREVAVAAADALATAAILRSEPPLAFRHPILRAAVLGRMGTCRREELEAAVTELLAENGQPSGRRRRHPDAVEWLSALLTHDDLSEDEFVQAVEALVMRLLVTDRQQELRALAEDLAPCVQRLAPLSRFRLETEVMRALAEADVSARGGVDDLRCTGV